MAYPKERITTRSHTLRLVGDFRRTKIASRPPPGGRGGSVGRVAPTQIFFAGLRAAGRSVGVYRVGNAKISFLESVGSVDVMVMVH